MPSADVSKRETPSKVDAPEEEHKPSPEQTSVAGKNAVEPSMTSVKFQASNPLPDADMNGNPSPEKRASVVVSPHTT
jgi:hypothetical protein